MGLSQRQVLFADGQTIPGTSARGVLLAVKPEFAHAKFWFLAVLPTCWGGFWR